MGAVLNTACRFQMLRQAIERSKVAKPPNVAAQEQLQQLPSCASAPSDASVCEKGMAEVSDCDDSVSPSASPGPGPGPGRDRPTPYLIRRLSNPDEPTLRGGPAAVFPSIDWWSSVIRNAAARQFDMVQFSRRVAVSSVCTGLGAELFIAKELGLPLDFIEVCDVKANCTSFLLKNFGSLAGNPDMHVWQSMEDSAAFHGKCLSHGFHRPPSAGHTVRVPIDLMLGGPPCQPYTCMRAGRKLKTPTGHKKFNTLFGDDDTEGGSYLACMRAKLPKIAILEQVAGFLNHERTLAMTPFDKFRDEVAQIVGPDGQPYYPMDGIVCLVLDSATWLGMDRSRLYAVAVSYEAGGATEAQAIIERLHEIVSYRATFAPALVKGLLASDFVASAAARFASAPSSGQQPPPQQVQAVSLFC